MVVPRSFALSAIALDVCRYLPRVPGMISTLFRCLPVFSPPPCAAGPPSCSASSRSACTPCNGSVSQKPPNFSGGPGCNTGFPTSGCKGGGLGPSFGFGTSSLDGIPRPALFSTAHSLFPPRRSIRVRISGQRAASRVHPTQPNCNFTRRRSLVVQPVARIGIRYVGAALRGLEKHRWCTLPPERRESP